MTRARAASTCALARPTPRGWLRISIHLLPGGVRLTTRRAASAADSRAASSGVTTRRSLRSRSAWARSKSRSAAARSDRPTKSARPRGRSPRAWRYVLAASRARPTCSAGSLVAGALSTTTPGPPGCWGRSPGFLRIAASPTSAPLLRGFLRVARPWAHRREPLHGLPERARGGVHVSAPGDRAVLPDAHDWLDRARHRPQADCARGAHGRARGGRDPLLPIGR